MFVMEKERGSNEILKASSYLSLEIQFQFGFLPLSLQYPLIHCLLPNQFTEDHMKKTNKEIGYKRAKFLSKSHITHKAQNNISPVLNPVPEDKAFPMSFIQPFCSPC